MVACDVQFPSNVAEKAENKPHKNILSTTKSTQKAYYCNYTVRHFFFTAPLIHNIIVLFTSTGLLNFYERFDEKKNVLLFLDINSGSKWFRSQILYFWCFLVVLCLVGLIPNLR